MTAELDQAGRHEKAIMAADAEDPLARMTRMLPAALKIDDETPALDLVVPSPDIRQPLVQQE
jgi:hypothetical protein